MQIPRTLSVTDQEIDVSHLSDTQVRYYEQLAHKLSTIYLENGAGRQIFCLSGPAGAGKSVVTALLEHFYQDEERFAYINVGLDAFHYSNEQLIQRDLKQFKGRYDTYNTDLLKEKLIRFAAGDQLLFPVYSRKLHEPIPAKIEVVAANTLLLLEGQWFLRNDETWRQIRTLCSYQLFLTAPAYVLKNNVIARHIAGGRTSDDAATFYENSDLLNRRLVLDESVEPDEVVHFYKDI